MEQATRLAERSAATLGTAQGLLSRTLTAGIDGLIGPACGLARVPFVTRAIVPVSGWWLFPEKG